METKELKVQIPEGYEIDKENSTFEKIVFKIKKKEISAPRSWEEYCRQQYEGENKIGYYIDDISGTPIAVEWQFCICPRKWVPSEELAKAFPAMMQLMSLRQAWIGDWQPVCGDDTHHYFCIVVVLDGIYSVEQFSRYHQTLSFPTKEMATDFMNCFSDLLEIAKPLI